MNSQYEIQMIYPDIHKNNTLTQLVTSLDSLQRVSDNIFEKINKIILEKKTKIENLKSRLYRAAKIIQSFEKLPKAMTLKCTRDYPSKKADNSQISYTSMYYNDVCDFNLVQNIKMREEPLNTKPYNFSSILGKNPDGSIEDVRLMEELIQCIDSFKEITQDFDNTKNETLSNFNDFPNDINHLLTVFEYFEKSVIYGDLKSINATRTLNETSMISEEAHTKKEKKSYFLEKLPTSISEKSELRKYNQEKHFIRKPNTNFQLDIPQSLNLKGIADINFQPHSNNEDYLNTNLYAYNGEAHAPSGNIIYDDLNFDYQAPIDFLKSYNLNKKTTELHSKENISNIPSNKTFENTNKSNNNLLNNNTSNNNNPHNNSETNKLQSLPVNRNIPNVPKIPNVPAIPKVPNVPSVPSIPVVPSVPSILKIPNFVEPSKLDVQALENRGSLLEQIRTENPLARLKKITVEVKKEEPVMIKKKEVKSLAANPHDLLKQAIALRFEKLNKNKHEDD